MMSCRKWSITIYLHNDKKCRVHFISPLSILKETIPNWRGLYITATCLPSTIDDLLDISIYEEGESISSLLYVLLAIVIPSTGIFYNWILGAHFVRGCSSDLCTCFPSISYKVDEAVHLLKSLCKRTATGHTISFIYCVHSHQEF